MRYAVGLIRASSRAPIKPSSVRIQGRIDRHKVALAHQSVEVDQFDPQVGRTFSRYIGVKT